MLKNIRANFRLFLKGRAFFTVAGMQYTGIWREQLYIT